MDMGNLIGKCGGLRIYFNNSGSLVSGYPGDHGGRVDLSGGAGHNHGVAGFGVPGGSLGRLRWDGFPEEDEIGFVDSATAAPGHHIFGHPLLFYQVSTATCGTDQLPAVSVVFNDISAPRPMVEIVDILGDYRLQLSISLQSSQEVVHWVGLCLGKVVKKEEPDHRPTLLGLPEESPYLENRRIVPAPEPVFSPEGGDPAFYRDAGPGKCDQVMGVVDRLCGGGKGVFHGDNLTA